MLMAVALLLSGGAIAEQVGSIRGMVSDKDFDAPLGAGQVAIVETGEKVTVTDDGNFVFGQVEPGTYTLVFSKEGYTRQVKGDVVVSSGQVTEVNASVSGDFAEMEEFIVQDLQLGGPSEIGLLNLRMESPALMDSISADLMSQAGSGDAASALKLVTGTSVQEGKYAVIRGLPDRYVNSQMNGVRLPTADPDKRAVQLDQFPSAAIESVQVSKTFTPDQQGDASGGAVNVILKGIPDETVFKFSVQGTYDTQATGNERFLSYKGGGVNWLGKQDRDIPSPLAFNEAVGVSPEDAPNEYKWSLTFGGKRDFLNGIKIGGLASLFYERDSSYCDEGVDDSYWVTITQPDRMTPQTKQGTPSWGSPETGDFKTALFDVTEGSEEVQWGGLGTLGLETEDHSLALTYMYTHSAEDTATLAEDTRGKKYFFPDYDRDDPSHPGNTNVGRSSAPYLRSQSIEYTERTTQTIQIRGDHKLPVGEWEIHDSFRLLPPEIDWFVAQSFSGLSQPDKRQFASLWQAKGEHETFPFIKYDEEYFMFQPEASFTIGNCQRIWKHISENSDQYAVNLKLPFEQWSGDEGYLKLGIFNDEVTREYEQDSFSNKFGIIQPSHQGSWDEYWSQVFPSEGHDLGPDDIDVDYDGEQRISACYWMVDVPLCSWFNLIGGIRYERTELSITNKHDITPENPADIGNVDFQQNDALPAVSFVLRPFEQLTLRGSYSETTARPTFKEMTPIVQQEYLGGDVFIGNAGLTMSALKNYDLRLDYRPYLGGLFSVSWFHKDIKDPIEYVQRVQPYTYTTPVNYPEGTLSGIELEARQEIGRLWEPLKGLTLGANATFIDSEVTLPDDEAAGFSEPAINAPMSTRDMTNAPEHLYNLYLTYDIERFGTQFGVFYTVKGDTLVAGAGESKGNFVPSLYQKEYGTLNLSVSQKLGEHWKLRFQAKNLLNPKIEEVYRSDYIPGDVTHTSFRKGTEFSLSVSASF